MPAIKLNIPPADFVIHTEKLTPTKMDEISDLLVTSKFNASIFGKYPILEDESLEDWHERISPDLQEEAKRKDDESSRSYVKRVLFTGESSNEKRKMVYEVLKGLAKLFNMEQRVTDEGLNQVGYPQVKEFIAKILKACDFPEAADFE